MVLQFIQSTSYSGRSIIRCRCSCFAFYSYSSQSPPPPTTPPSTYRDEALHWAEKNPEQAKACLRIPPIPIAREATTNSGLQDDKDDGGRYSTSDSENDIHLRPPSPRKMAVASRLQQYWMWRGWKFPLVENNNSSSKSDNMRQRQEKKYGQALVSHVLSSPLTMASQLLSSCDGGNPAPTAAAKNHNGIKTMNDNRTTIVNHGNNNNNHYHNITSNNMGINQQQNKLKLRWCCIGARAEATLPLNYWKEVLVYHHYLNEAALPRTMPETETQPSFSLSSLSIDFIGPDLAEQSCRADPVLLQHHNSSLYLRWLFQGTFHDYLKQTAATAAAAAAASRGKGHEEVNTEIEGTSWDGYILLNPGLGYPHLRKSWKPTLDLLFNNSAMTDTIQYDGSNNTAKSNILTNTTNNNNSRHHERTILLTAHSGLDANRDAAHLQKWYGDRILPCNLEKAASPSFSYQKNPFASRISYVDPLDPRHFIRPNAYVALVRV